MCRNVFNPRHQGLADRLPTPGRRLTRPPAHLYPAPQHYLPRRGSFNLNNRLSSSSIAMLQTSQRVVVITGVWRGVSNPHPCRPSCAERYNMRFARSCLESTFSSSGRVAAYMQPCLGFLYASHDCPTLCESLAVPRRLKAWKTNAPRHPRSRIRSRKSLGFPWIITALRPFVTGKRNSARTTTRFRIALKTRRMTRWELVRFNQTVD